MSRSTSEERAFRTRDARRPAQVRFEADQPDGDYSAGVIVAEDDAEMRRVVVETLRSEGYRVYEVTNGAELTAFVEKGHLHGQPFNDVIDLIVSDIRMPECSGLRALADIRVTDWSIPAILITAFSDRSTQEEAYRLGAATVLDKPFELGELLAAVKSIVPPNF